ncbi:hypothetical protein C0Q70_13499 [Pomacea canaliculata]|uniref:Uncharacterized protein n=1 Tax=Pomacea canaliculata TaxID=400727 RepID=A0A2T7NXE4_POMCA|nr:hypothetical protein C0Q70_13499 [Pomacea canaliculata]
MEALINQPTIRPLQADVKRLVHAGNNETKVARLTCDGGGVGGFGFSCLKAGLAPKGTATISNFLLPLTIGDT